MKEICSAVIHHTTSYADRKRYTYSVATWVLPMPPMPCRATGWAPEMTTVPPPPRNWARSPRRSSSRPVNRGLRRGALNTTGSTPG